MSTPAKNFYAAFENEINVWQEGGRIVFLFSDRGSPRRFLSRILVFRSSFPFFSFSFPFPFFPFQKLSLRFELQKCILNCVSWLRRREGALSRMSCAHLSPVVPRTFVSLFESGSMHRVFPVSVTLLPTIVSVDKRVTPAFHLN